MNAFPFFKKNIFSKAEVQQIADAIATSEKKTSGEIRIYLEPKCTVEPVVRAHAIFQELGMGKTQARNGVLIYLAYKDKKFAICGDQAIHEISGQAFWDNVVAEMQKHFSQKEILKGVLIAIEMAGDKLQTYFPYQKGDRNELSDTPIIN